MAQSLQVQTRRTGNVLVVDLSGPMMSGSNLQDLRLAVRDAVADGETRLLLNCSGVGYIDSAGLGELIISFTTVRNRAGELKLLNLSPKVSDLLAKMRLLSLFDVFADEATAVNSFRS